MLLIAVGVLAVLVLAIFGGGLIYDNVVRAEGLAPAAAAAASNA